MFLIYETDPDSQIVVGNAGIPDDSDYKATICFSIGDLKFVDIRVTKEQLITLKQQVETAIAFIDIEESRKQRLRSDWLESRQILAQMPELDLSNLKNQE
jgi:hypothetical protein